MKKTILLVLMATIGLASCNSGNQQQESINEKKSVVVYYSQTNATRTVAEQFQTLLGADIVEIEAVEAYDGDFQATINRSMAEKNEGRLPDIKPIDTDWSQYDVIFLGYPIWFGTYALPVATFLQTADLKGKTIVPFCTFGSGGLNTSTADLKQALPESTILEGYGVRNARLADAPAEVENFLKQGGYIEGEAAPSIEYGDEQPVTEQDVAVYDAACGDYPMLHATPISVATTDTDAATYYLFTAEENGSTLQVKVVAPKADGATPVFTEVIR